MAISTLAKDKEQLIDEVKKLKEELESVTNSSSQLLKQELLKRKNMQEALSKSADKYHMLFNASDDLIYISDLDFRSIFSVNDTACRNLNYSREEFLKLHLKQVVKYDISTKRNRKKNDLLDEILKGKNVRFEAEAITKDGEKIPVEVKSHKIELDDYEAILHIARDIEDRKKMELELQSYTQNLEKIVKERTKRISELEKQRTEIEKMAATGRMAAQIAHEINNPLAGIKNSFLLIKDAISKDHPYFSYAGLIEKEIDRIANIVRQMFDLYRPDQRTAYKFSLSESIKDVVSLLEPTRREKEISINIKYSDPDFMVFLPESSLRQVVFNVLKNALEISPINSVISIDVLSKKKYFCINISDQGPGISDRDQRKIFEPFYSKKSSKKTRGMGLGLSISKGITDALKGGLSVDSKKGFGSNFKIKFPSYIECEDDDSYEFTL